ALQDEVEHAFNVKRLREKIDQVRLVDSVAGLDEHLEVARKRRWVARYVCDAGHSHRPKRGRYLAPQSYAGRVYDQGIEPTFFGQVRNEFIHRDWIYRNIRRAINFQVVNRERRRLDRGHLLVP